jgi:hypothetical protein
MLEIFQCDRNLDKPTWKLETNLSWCVNEEQPVHGDLAVDGDQDHK